MANNTAISAKRTMHMLLNESDRLSAYWCRIHDVATDTIGFNKSNRYGKGSYTEVQSHCNTDMRRKRLLFYGNYRR
ncbi:MAG: hypothetical protein J6I76_11605 [Oribacterium sp.]|nr:hypothetical protein [Oribacterium sp.]MBP3804522.1 hypothetical protein [Oribacterium sp.]